MVIRCCAASGLRYRNSAACGFNSATYAGASGSRPGELLLLLSASAGSGSGSCCGSRRSTTGTPPAMPRDQPRGFPRETPRCPTPPPLPQRPLRISITQRHLRVRTYTVARRLCTQGRCNLWDASGLRGGDLVERSRCCEIWQQAIQIREWRAVVPRGCQRVHSASNVCEGGLIRRRKSAATRDYTYSSRAVRTRRRGRARRARRANCAKRERTAHKSRVYYE